MIQASEAKSCVSKVDSIATSDLLQCPSSGLPDSESSLKRQDNPIYVYKFEYFTLKAHELACMSTSIQKDELAHSAACPKGPKSERALRKYRMQLPRQ